MSEEITKLHEVITSMRLDIARLDTKMDIIKDFTQKVNNVESTANDALNKVNLVDSRLTTLEDNHKWLWRTVATGLILGAIGMYFKLKAGV